MLRAKPKRKCTRCFALNGLDKAVCWRCGFNFQSYDPTVKRCPVCEDTGRIVINGRPEFCTFHHTKVQPG